MRVRLLLLSLLVPSGVVLAQSPTIGLSSNSASFTKVAGSGPSPTQIISITNGGGGSLSNLSRTITYAAGQPTGWLTAPLSGSTAPATVTLQAKAALDLLAGTYTATVSIKNKGATNTPQNIAVTFTVTGVAPAIAVASAATLTAPAGGLTPVTQTLGVTNGGNGSLGGLGRSISYAVGEPTGWLSATLGGTTAPATLSLSATPSRSLATGTYHATVLIRSSQATNSPQSIAVTFNVTGRNPTIVLSPPTASFTAAQGSGNTLTQNIAISNGGDGVLNGIKRSISYAPGQPTGWLNATLSTNTAPTNLALTAKAARSLPAGNYQASVQISSPNAINSPQTVDVNFTVASGTAVLRLTPTTHDFGSVGVGLTSAPFSFTLTNTGSVATGPLTGGGITGANAAEFNSGLTSTCPGSLAAGASCQIVLVFRPLAEGLHTATMTVVATTPGGTVSAALTGTGVPAMLLELTPTTHDFGSVGVGLTSAPFSFTLTNTGSVATGPLTGGGITGANAAEFNSGLTSTCPGSLAAGASCQIVLVFRPLAEGLHTATMTVVATTPGGTVSAALTGTGVPAMLLELTPTTHDFGSVGVGLTSAPFSFTLTNTGSVATGPLTGGGITGANAAEFNSGLTSTCPGSLAAGASCQIVLVFRPLAEGLHTATMTVVATTPGGTVSAALSGTGVAAVATLTLTPAPHDFGSVILGQASAPFTFTVTNTGGTASGVLTVSLSQGNVSDFSIAANTCFAHTLAPNASCTFSVDFAPPAAGLRSTTLSVAGTSPGAIASTPLSGTGVAVAFNVASAASTGNQSMTVTFDAPPNAIQATTLGNYSVPGLVLSGTPTLAGNTATLTTAAQTAPTYTVTVSDVTRANDGEPLTTTAAQFTSTAENSWTSLVSSLNPSLVGQPVTFAAFVFTNLGTLPTGSVRFEADGAPLQVVFLVDGVATFTISSLPEGAHTIVANYSGDTVGTIVQPSTDRRTQVVGPALSTTTLTSSLNPSVVGQPVTLTATVTTNLGTPPSVGAVDFVASTNGGTLETLTGQQVVLANGVATLTTSSLPEGSTTIIAEYSVSAEETVHSSSSPPLTQVVGPNLSTTTVTSFPNPSLVGQPVTLIATVTTDLGTPPSGAVDFVASTNGVLTDPVSLVNGIATLTTSSLPEGSTLITARYYGVSVGAIVQPSVSLSHLQIVDRPPSIAASPNTGTLAIHLDQTLDLPVSITNGGDRRLTELAVGTIVDDATGQPIPWVSATLSDNIDPATLTVHFAPRTGGVQNYQRALIPITATGALPFTLTVDVYVTRNEIAVGDNHTCRGGSALQCWGANVSGQLGDGTTADRSTPAAAAGGGATIDLSAGGSHTCVARSGDAECWGDNTSLQLPDATAVPYSADPVGFGFHATSVGAGQADGQFTCVVKSGDVFCLGNNAYGQLGNGQTSATPINPVVQVDLPSSGFIEVATGEHHACALSSGGAIYCWGDNSYGQLGTGSEAGPHPTAELVPVPGNALRDQSWGNQFWAHVSAGYNHTCAITSAGWAWCWGLDDHGQLGDGQNDVETTPIPVSQPQLFRGISAGGNSTCGLEILGSVFYCWGDNSHGQLGLGDQNDRSLPAILYLSNFQLQDITVGINHSCARTANGDYCWGENSFGQLGDGTTSPSLTPVPVLTVSAVVAMPGAERVDFTADEAARDLLGAGTLTAAQRSYLDRTGNHDGSYDLGDLLAFLDRTHTKLRPGLLAPRADRPSVAQGKERTP